MSSGNEAVPVAMPLDPVEVAVAESKAFTARMMDTVGKGYLTLGLALGSQLGLLQALVAAKGTMTSAELADKCGCKERYVREWLAMMVAESVVTVDKEGERYIMPPSHYEGLAAIHSLAPSVPLLAQAHLPLMEAFKKDGPNGLTSQQASAWYSLFQESRPHVMEHLQPQLIAHIEGLQEKLESGITACVIGCDRGPGVHWLATHYPNSQFTGIDVAKQSIVVASKEADQQDLDNTYFKVADAANLPADWTDKYDHVLLIDTLHDIPHATPACKEFYRILKPGGSLSILDIQAHSNPAQNVGNEYMKMMYSYSLYSCLPLSLAVEGSEGLGTCMGVERMTEMLAAAGFDLTRMTTVDMHDCVHLVLVK